MLWSKVPGPVHYGISHDRQSTGWHSRDLLPGNSGGLGSPLMSGGGRDPLAYPPACLLRVHSAGLVTTVDDGIGAATAIVGMHVLVLHF